ncbi:hypothetical protein BDR03DRAFT_1017350 [Suillus americanus]|nr:hypothetical protein BDR03DRAFT_1017350 [Suillus americanus]
MASNLTDQGSEVTKAVALGHLSKFVDVDVQGEMLDSKMTYGCPVVYARQRSRSCVFGKHVQDNVNFMAMNLTNRVRSLAEVTKAVAGGDLTKSTCEGSLVAREVGTEGRLGGRARLTSVGGTREDLTDNVNVMAANSEYCCRNREYCLPRPNPSVEFVVRLPSPAET